MPLFSIVITTLNSSATISRALESIVCQTCCDFELIVQDGISSDNTIVLIEQYQKKMPGQIHVFIEKDEGIYDAMNKALAKVTGQWVYFLGSDDMFFGPSVLEEVGLCLKDGNDFLYGNVLIDGNAGWAKDGQWYGGRFSLLNLFQKNICHQAIFYKKALLDKVGKFNTDFKVCSDWDLNHRCFAVCKPFYIDKVIARFAGGGASTGSQSDLFTDYTNVGLLKKYHSLSFFYKGFYNWQFQLHYKMKAELAASHFWNALVCMSALIYHSRKAWPLYEFISCLKK